ncbi:MAG: DoxX family protein [Pseudomonadota bacterium]
MEVVTNGNSFLKHVSGGQMTMVAFLLKLIAGLGIYNVWFLRRNQATAYRGKNATNMKEEFAAYGLPQWAFFMIGFLKIGFASLILASLWSPQLIVIGAAGLGVLMLGAVLMHVKVKDQFIKTVPALLMLLICGALIFLQQSQISNFALN